MLGLLCQAFTLVAGFSRRLFPENPSNLVDGFSQGIRVISPSIVSKGVLEYCRMLGTKPEYADFQFYIFKLLLYKTS